MENKAVETMFLVVVNEDSTLTSYSELPETLPGANRLANNYDVYQSCKQIVEEFESSLLVNKITQAVVNALVPQQPTQADIIKDALKERGISPESTDA